MGLSIYLNNAIIKSKLSDALAKYDPDQNGFTKQEFNYAINDITSIFARCIIKMTGFDTTLFNELNTDKNDVISYEEISDYIKKEYELDFNTISTMTLSDICTKVDKINKKKKSK